MPGSLAKKCDKESAKTLDIADLSSICAKYLLNSTGPISLGIYVRGDFDDWKVKAYVNHNLVEIEEQALIIFEMLSGIAEFAGTNITNIPHVFSVEDLEELVDEVPFFLDGYNFIYSPIAEGEQESDTVLLVMGDKPFTVDQVDNMHEIALCFAEHVHRAKNINNRMKKFMNEEDTGYGGYGDNNDFPF